MAEVRRNKATFAAQKYLFFWSSGVSYIVATWLFLDAFFSSGVFVGTAGFYKLILEEMFLLYVGNFCWVRYLIIQSGLRGEQRALALTRTLPRGYHILTNIPLNDDGRVGEIDQLILGPTGVFAIEVKNHKGLIEGDVKEPMWVQTREGQSSEYSKPFENPMKQLVRNISIAKNMMRKNGIEVWIEPVVYFSNEDADVEVDDERVVSDPGKLMEIIVGNKPRPPLTEETIEKIVAMFGGN